MSNRSAAFKATAKESDEFSKQIETIREDLSDLTKTVSRMARTGVSEAQDTVREKAGEVSERARDSVGELETAVRRNPLQAAIVAIGLGFVIGLVARR